jgi:RimJ/RimL family protein N-acetyltransferase
MAFVFVDRATNRLIGSSRYYGFEPGLSEIEIGWTFLSRSHWGGRANREVKRLMLDHAFTFVDTVVFWVGDQNWRPR